MEKLVLARRYDIPDWLEPAYVALTQRAEPIREAEAEMLGLSTFVKIARDREVFREERRTKEAEEKTAACAATLPAVADVVDATIHEPGNLQAPALENPLAAPPNEIGVGCSDEPCEIPDASDSPPRAICDQVLAAELPDQPPRKKISKAGVRRRKKLERIAAAIDQSGGTRRATIFIFLLVLTIT